MSTEVAVIDENALAVFDEVEGMTGFENVDDIQVRAFIQLANHVNHLEWEEGIKLGDIHNSLTGDIYTEPIRFIPCVVDKYVSEYTGENKFVGRHPIDGSEYQDALERADRDDKGRIDYKTVFNKAGNTLTASHDIYSMISPDGGDSWMPAIIPMTSTKITPYTRFFKTLEIRPRKTPTGIRPAALFENVCQLSVKTEQKGSNTYSNYKFKFIEHINDSVLAKNVVEYAKDSKQNIEERANG